MSIENPTEYDQGEKKYPEALRRDFREGGFTFLKRVLHEHLNNGKPVVIDSGRNYFEYTYTPGQRTFMDGITILEKKDDRNFDAFKSVADQYIVQRGIEEIRAGSNN